MNGNGISDERLMMSLAGGDPDALAEIYMRYGAMVRFGVIRNARGVTDVDVEEICQDVFLAVHEGAKRYQSQGRFKSWLYSITVRKTKAWRRKTWLKRKMRDKRQLQNEAVQDIYRSSYGERLAHRQEIGRALEALRPSLREVFLLHVIEEFSCEEIGEILGLTIGNVWTRLHRARQILSDSIESYSLDVKQVEVES